MLITTGGPLEMGSFLSQYRTYAEVAKATIVKSGIDERYVVAASAPNTGKDRTYVSFVAVRQYFELSGIKTNNVNLFSLGPHARISRFLFVKAFDGKMDVGIISAPDGRYDKKRWWRSSAGFRTVTGEAIAYVYARLFFKGQ